MSRLYVRGVSRVAGNEYSPLRSVTTATLTVLPTAFARTKTPSIGPSVSEFTRPARANGAGWSVLAANGPATPTPKANTHKMFLSIIRFPKSGNQLTGNIDLT